MDPRLIRANIALFKGKRFETKRLLEEYVVDQENPDQARRDPLLLWLDAHAHPRHAERVGGLRNLVENVPQDTSYHQMAQAFLQDEDHYAELLDPDKKRRSRVRPWQVAVGLLLIGLVIVALVVITNQPSQQEVLTVADATVEVTDEPTPLPSPTPTATPIVQNTPAPATLSDGSRPTTGLEVLDFNGAITVLNIDNDIRYVVNQAGEKAEAADSGAKFYGLLLEFQCLIALCNNVPEAEIYVELAEGNFRVLASEGLTIAGQPSLAPRVSQGQKATGWVIFEVPRTNPPDSLVVWPFEEPNSEERPEPIVVPLP